MIKAADELLADGRAALRVGDAVGARRAFERTCLDSISAEALEGLARAAYLELDYTQAIAGLEQAYAIYRTDDDRVSAVRVARTLSYICFSAAGDRAIGGGWLARSRTLLTGAGESPERGWVALTIGMFENNRERKHEAFTEALEVARSAKDTDLELTALAYFGASLVHADCVEEGMRLLDEALAALAGGEVDDFFVLEEVFCQLFAACEHAHDVSRADQWIRVGEAIAARRGLPAVSAFCRTHYGGVLTAAGRWSEADVALTDAVRVWGLGSRSVLRAGALIRLADLRVRQGRYEEAAQLLEGLDAAGDAEAARPLAAIHLANGDASLAIDVLERALAQLDAGSTLAAPLLSLIVDAHLAAGDVQEAEVAAVVLASSAAEHPSPYLMAVAALARGRVCLTAGTGRAQTHLRQALAGFTRAQMPLEVAHVRLDLARTMATERPEAAKAEARAALGAFELLRATRHADAAAAMLRSLGVRANTNRIDGVLTRREGEVLELLGHGLSNPEIADRLFISRKTVEHHVGNILAKLGLRSRAEAAAHSARTKPARE